MAEFEAWATQAMKFLGVDEWGWQKIETPTGANTECQRMTFVIKELGGVFSLIAPDDFHDRYTPTPDVEGAG